MSANQPIRLPVQPRPATAPQTVVHLQGLTRSFGGRTVLDNISLTIARGEFVALIGKSGSGKSTLLRAAAHLDDGATGEGLVDVPQSCSVLFQDSRLLPWENVLDNVTIGLHGADTQQQGLAALAAVGLADRAGAWPNVLSGGEQQRVALARSLVRQPELLLADEPFGALDALTRIKMHHLLRDLVRVHHPAVLLVTHDVDEALVLADRVLLIEDGRIALDRGVDMPHPRRKTDGRFEKLRNILLASLGVTGED